MKRFRKSIICLITFAAIIALFAGCGAKTYETFSLKTASELTPVESGAYGINFTVTPAYIDREWRLNAVFTMDSGSPAVDNLLGNYYSLEYLVSDVWYSIRVSSNADEMARGYVVTDIGYSLITGEPLALTYHTECYGTFLFEGDYRVISYVTIDGEDIPYAAEFHLEGEGTTPYLGDA